MGVPGTSIVSTNLRQPVRLLSPAITRRCRVVTSWFWEKRIARWWQLKDFLFSSLQGEMIPILTSIFFNWVGSTTNNIRLIWKLETPQENDGNVIWTQTFLREERIVFQSSNHQFSRGQAARLREGKWFSKQLGGVIWMHFFGEMNLVAIIGFVVRFDFVRNQQRQIIATSHDLGPQMVV